MDRRKSLKLIATGAIAAPAVLAGCKNEDQTTEVAKEPQFNLDRSKEEIEIEKETKFKRYVRTILDHDVHLKEFKEWKERFEIFRNENGSHLSFEELYEQPPKKRKVRKLENSIKASSEIRKH